MPSCQSLSYLSVHPPSPRLRALELTHSGHSQTAQEATTTTTPVSPPAHCSNTPTSGTSCLCSAFLLSSLPPWEAGRDYGIAAWRESCPLASLLSHHRHEEVESTRNDVQETLQLFGEDLVETLPGEQEATGAAGVRATAAAGSAQWTQLRQKGKPQQCLALGEGIKKLNEAGCVSKGEREQKRGGDERQAV